MALWFTYLIRLRRRRLMSQRRWICRGVAPRDGGNYIPRVIRYATGDDLVECSVKAAMGETTDIPAIDLRVEENNVVENHLIVRLGDEIHTFIGANSTLGVLVMRFDSLYSNGRQKTQYR